MEALYNYYINLLLHTKMHKKLYNIEKKKKKCYNSLHSSEHGKNIHI
jgi:hypothetical protein